ncbi:MAG: hypothetical protein ACYDAR_20405 [Thermomicrobiales bacterium]
MDLMVFSVVLILVIFAAFGLAIWAVAKEEMRMQAAWGMRASVPPVSASEPAMPDLSAPVPVVVPAPVAQSASAPLVPAL